jgi:hypothetical protein
VAVDYDAPRKPQEEAEAESLEEVKAVAGSRATQQLPEIEVDEAVAAESFELPGADLSGVELDIQVTPQQADEFMCTNCFLVHHHSQRVSSLANLCRDCA